jgi:hypothetical protein
MEKKKKWYVREEQTITRFWEYEVEAETEEEAERMVKEGDVEPYEYSWTDERDFPIQIVEVSEIDED